MRVRKKRILWVLMVAGIVVMGMSIFASVIVRRAALGRIFDVSRVPKCKVALVLGSKVFPNGNLSGLTADRVNTAISLYRAGKVEKLLISGDNRYAHYNEPKRMCEYAVKHGVPEKDIVMDFAGRRTYDSIYRAKHIFGQDRIIIVTQRFHLARALYLSKELGVDAYGVPGRWVGQRRDRVREIPAALSAYLDTHFWHPKPILGKKEKV